MPTRPREWYPYSAALRLQRTDPRTSDATETSLSDVLSGDKNYIRNSVKVVVDAYDGTMKFYIDR